VPFPVAIHRQSTFVGTSDAMRIFAEEPPSQRFSCTASATYRGDHAFHVDKIPTTAGAEGRGAKDVVALELRRRLVSSRIVSSYRRKREVAHVDQHEERRARTG